MSQHTRKRASRLAAAGLLIALMACGGGSDDGATATDTTPAEQNGDVGALDDPQLVALTDAVVADVGEDAVFAAVALAIDRGYAVRQLADVAGTGAISADGTIAGITPAEEPFGLLVAGDAVVQSFRRSAVPVTTTGELEEPIVTGFDDLAEPPSHAVSAGTLVMLVEMGYSFDQVVEGLVFGELTIRYGTELKTYTVGSEVHRFKCIAFVDATGKVVPPEREPERGEFVVDRAFQCGRQARDGELLTKDEAARAVAESLGGSETTNEPPPTEATEPSGDAPTTEEPTQPTEPAFPRAYRGDGTHILRDVVYDEPMSCTTPGPMELTLAEDGTATFTYFNGVGVNATLTADGEPVITCEARPGNTWIGLYDPTLGTFEIVAPTPGGFDEWDIGGIFDEKTADVLGGYSLPQNPAGQQLTVEIEAALTLV